MLMQVPASPANPESQYVANASRAPFFTRDGHADIAGAKCMPVYMSQDFSSVWRLTLFIFSSQKVVSLSKNNKAIILGGK